MFTHPPPVSKKEVNMTRFEAALYTELVKAKIQNLGLPKEVIEKVNSALELTLQSAIENSKPK